MNLQKDDYRGLLNQIMVAADKTFTELQIVSLIETMQSVGWSTSYRVAMLVTRTGNLPKNIYGYFLNLLEEEAERIRKAFLEKDNWQVADDDCIRPEEFSLMMKCIALICRFRNSNEISQKFGDYLIAAQEKGKLLEALKKAHEFYSQQLNESTQKKTSGL